jgi:hypothetical protein
MGAATAALGDDPPPAASPPATIVASRTAHSTVTGRAPRIG